MEPDDKQFSPELAAALDQVRAASNDLVIPIALGAAREHLGMDSAYLSSIDDGAQTIEAVMGNPSPVGVITRTEFPMSETFCQRMLDGQIPNAVPDTRAEPAVRDLRATENVRSYIGVPVYLADGRLHGAFCAAGHDTNSGLGEEQTRFMKALASLVAARLETSAH